MNRQLCLVLALIGGLAWTETTAQTVKKPAETTEQKVRAERSAGNAVVESEELTPRYGVISYDSLLFAMPEYAEAMARLDKLREQYREETDYNAANFKRLFVEFLDGQKNFPKSILLKRQRDLQNEMERDLAFRQKADSLLADAEKELLQPVKDKLNMAIHAVGSERGYDLIINTDNHVYPYYNASLTEEATPYVEAKLYPEKQ